MFGTVQANTVAVSLLKEFNIDEAHVAGLLDTLQQADARYLKDLKINVANVLSGENISRQEALLLAYSVAINEKNPVLREAFEKAAKDAGADDKAIADVISCTSLLNANNVYYRFRHFMQDDFYNNAPAGIRMSIMANPSIGKEFFELVSLAVSALNGCEMCVTSHEKTLVAAGTTKSRIHDAVRLAAVIKSLSVLIG